VTPANNIAFYREKLEKKTVANTISKYDNFYWYNYNTISAFWHCHSFSFG